MVATRTCVYNGISAVQDDRDLFSSRVVGLEGQLGVMVRVVWGWMVHQPEPDRRVRGTLEDDGDLGKLTSSHHC